MSGGYNTTGFQFKYHVTNDLWTRDVHICTLQTIVGVDGGKCRFHVS